MKRGFGLMIITALVIFSHLPVEASKVRAQINYGMTGLMNMPTADMNRDKTFMAGASWLNHHTTVPRWWYDTFNYSINITIFPWLEVGYLLMGHKAVKVDYENKSGYWVPYTYGKFINQDRSFHGKLRLWKEGWWKSWTPQIVIGGNDVLGGSWHGGSLNTSSGEGEGNNRLTRYYLSISKHFLFDNIGELGTHFSWIYSNRYDNKLNDPSFGVNFKFDLPHDSFVNRMINGVNLMAEVLPGYTEVNEDLTFREDGKKWQANIGILYSCWKDYINAVVQCNNGKYFSAGMVFKVHLK